VFQHEKLYASATVMSVVILIETVDAPSREPNTLEMSFCVVPVTLFASAPALAGNEEVGLCRVYRHRVGASRRYRRKLAHVRAESMATRQHLPTSPKAQRVRSRHLGREVERQAGLACSVVAKRLLMPPWRPEAAYAHRPQASRYIENCAAEWQVLAEI